MALQLASSDAVLMLQLAPPLARRTATLPMPQHATRPVLQLVLELAWQRTQSQRCNRCRRHAIVGAADGPP
eukprot:14104229-Alexandrium_andersonii.AAC.1